ncbi:Hypothetical predicted protein [Mytilus galloprovincialis]|uniref:Protein furry C-terminal domain-containing protein n=1 Tax=Mytilus galloprovincialis TaxID=29158 RepID=A0A8B6GBU6_MYTGA|nr:Hypothetical predicted protein [Mytilus galloprovincialis]
MNKDNDFFTLPDSRRHSLQMLTPTGSNGHTQFGSVPDLKLLGAMSLAESPISPSDSISLHEEKIADTELPEEDGMPKLPLVTSITIKSPRLEESRRSSVSSCSTHSIASSDSDMEQVELSSSATSPGFSQIHSTFMYLTIQTDEVEETWKSHVAKVMSESSALLTLNTTHIFPKLYKELRRRLDTMTKEACYYIAKTDSLKHIATQLNILLSNTCNRNVNNMNIQLSSFGFLELQVTKVELRVTKVEKRFKKVELRVTKVELRVTEVELRVTKVEMRVTKVEMQVKKVELRVTKVKLRVTKVELRVTKVKMRDKKVEFRVTKVKLRVKKVKLRTTKVELLVTKVEL